MRRLTSPSIQRVFNDWGWATPNPTSAQLDDAEADVETEMGWTARAALMVHELAAEVTHEEETYSTHVTIKKDDIRAKVAAAIAKEAQPDTAAKAKKAAVKALRTAKYHVTVEWFGANHADNPKWFSNTATWEKKPDGFDDAEGAQGAVDGGTAAVTGLGA